MLTNDGASPDEPLAEPRLVVAETPAGAATRFRPFWTIASAALLVPVLALAIWPSSPDSRLASLEAPERALARVVERTLDVRDAVARAPGWERRLYAALGLESPSDLVQALAWYEQLARQSLDPGVDLHLAILEAEAGRLHAVRRRAEEWEGREEPFPSLALLVREAWLGETEGPEAPDVDLAAEWLGDGWFRDRIEIALARRAGDRVRERLVTDRLAARGHGFLQRIRLIGVALVLAVVLGMTAIAWFVARRRRDPSALSIGTITIPPPWPGRLGVAVLLRGGALSALVMLALPAVLPSLGRGERVAGVLDVLTGVLVALPAVVLAWRHLLNPSGLGLVEGLGFWLAPGGGPRLALAIPVVVAVVFVGDWAIGAVADLAGVSGHWTEWFDEDLVFGGGGAVAATLGGAVVLAPLAEEVTFRGLLFATLRRKLSWPAAAALSAVAFALLHGYGAAGFASVWWSGCVWAWAYERTRSLWPAIASHAVGNLWASLLLVGVLRA
jgi:membrane protease YdiL (CAAX protease family)